MLSLPAQDLADALHQGCDPHLLHPFLIDAIDRLVRLEATPASDVIHGALERAETAVMAPMVFGGDLPSPVLSLLGTIALDVGALVDHLRRSEAERQQLRDALHATRGVDLPHAHPHQAGPCG